MTSTRVSSREGDSLPARQARAGWSRLEGRLRAVSPSGLARLALTLLAIARDLLRYAYGRLADRSARPVCSQSSHCRDPRPAAAGVARFPTAGA
jgi:hypothetical protein